MPWNFEWTITNGTTVRAQRAQVPTIAERNGRIRDAQRVPSPADAATEPNERTRFAEQMATAADAAGLVSVTATRHPSGPLLQMDDALYEDIADAIEYGQVVPFFGAGASYCVRSANEKWIPGADIPPSARELAEYLAGMCEYHGTSPQDCEDLARIATRFTQMNGRPRLVRTLRRIFKPRAETETGDTPDRMRHDARPLQTPHWLLAKILAKIDKPMLIVTTNYDTLIEDAFIKEGRNDFDIVVHSNIKAHLNSVLLLKPDTKSEHFRFQEPVAVGLSTLSAEIDPQKRTVIYKMHGSVTAERDWDSFVIDEEDYVNFLARMNVGQSIIPGVIGEFLVGRSCLFLGYSLRDWNLRVLLQTLKLQDSETIHWAIQYFPTQTETDLWKGRNVQIYHVDLLDFVERLAKKLNIPPPPPPPAPPILPISPPPPALPPPELLEFVKELEKALNPPQPPPPKQDDRPIPADSMTKE